MAPIVDGLEAEYGDRVTFRRLNANEEGEALFAELRLPGHPAMVIAAADGREVARLFGIVDEARLRQALDAVS